MIVNIIKNRPIPFDLFDPTELNKSLHSTCNYYTVNFGALSLQITERARTTTQPNARLICPLEAKAYWTKRHTHVLEPRNVL